MELAGRQRDYHYRQMVRWWLFSGLSWFGLAVGTVTRCCHVLPGHRPAIGGHCRVGAFPSRRGCDQNNAATTGHLLFLFVFFSPPRWMSPDLDHIWVYLNEAKSKLDKENKWKRDQKKNPCTQRRNENREKWKQRWERKNKTNIRGLVWVCPWINLARKCKNRICSLIEGD